MCWFSVNWNFQPSELVYSNGGKFHVKETQTIHPRGKSIYPEAAPGGQGSGVRCMRSAWSLPNSFLSLAETVL